MSGVAGFLPSTVCDMFLPFYDKFDKTPIFHLSLSRGRFPDHRAGNFMMKRMLEKNGWNNTAPTQNQH